MHIFLQQQGDSQYMQHQQHIHYYQIFYRPQRIMFYLLEFQGELV